MIRERIKKMPTREKVRLAIFLIWMLIAIIILVVLIPIGVRNVEKQPLIIMISKIFTTSLPIYMIAQSILQRKNIVLTFVCSVILFVFAFWLLILPMIS